MPEYVPDSATNKLTLLFMLDRMEIPLTENSILDICTNKNNWLKYMDCIEIISQLMESKLIYVAVPNAESPLYAISYEGSNCLSMFYQNIPITLREEITTFANLNIAHIKKNQEYVSNYQKMPDGSYLTTFEIKDPHLQQSIFEIKIKIDNRSQAISACKKWIDKAPDIYENIYLTLIND